jgi:hypothetical protein
MYKGLSSALSIFLKEATFRRETLPEISRGPFLIRPQEIISPTRNYSRLGNSHLVTSDQNG